MTAEQATEALAAHIHAHGMIPPPTCDACRERARKRVMALDKHPQTLWCLGTGCSFNVTVDKP